jgi:hypothetical protein
MNTGPIFPRFKMLELKDQGAVEAFTCRFEPYSDLNFTSLWSWDVAEEVEWSVLNGNLIVRLPNYGTEGPSRWTIIGDAELTTTVY